MRELVAKNETVKFAPKSIGAKWLSELKDTKTLSAFQAGGKPLWTEYLEGLSSSTTLDGLDNFKIDFFTSLLGRDLYNQTTKANDYEAAFVVHNRYLAWGRSCICDFSS